MLIGHERIIKDLEYLAKSRDFSHAYLFFGTEQVGKRRVALGLANYFEKGIFDPPASTSSSLGGPGEPPSAGGEPRLHGGGRPLNDTRQIEPSPEKTIGINVVRELKNYLSQKPNVSPYRLVIINDAEFLTPEAQNALLRLTEEPPPSSLLILVLRDPESLTPTLTSRFQKIYFGTVQTSIVKVWLEKELKISVKKAEEVAKISRGKPGLAYSMLKDKNFEALTRTAEKFSKVPKRDRRLFLKKLLESKNFNFPAFLDALVINLEPKKVDNFHLWHKILELKRKMTYFNLNPRLQLENLLEAFVSR
ncbi:MAG: hypothetical protein HYT13_01775 [Candidatus Liptonbacteria bacterium]|nr:hypothetical protein [Candidatus Liptonbacteria bacterium]